LEKITSYLGSMGKLYIVSTPIGNLEDITLRALRVLKEVDLIAAEDTRRTKKLLTHFEITTKITSYFEHNKFSKIDKILESLHLGDVALVSDSGMPTISDPGYRIVHASLELGYEVVCIPGASAVLAAVAVSGLPTDAFVYLGFLPRKTLDRKRTLHNNATDTRTLIFFESPHRLLDCLIDVHRELGDRHIVIAREMTKIHEEIYRGNVIDAITHFEQGLIRGECTVVVSGNISLEHEKWQADRVLLHLNNAIHTGQTLSSASREIAKKSGWTRQEVYGLKLDK
tara:strand:+ start:4033 stop:4884 length:852 start_codon:yes stop_codon:yes gene_type:complete